MGLLDGITEWVRDVVEAAHYPGVAAMIALENIFPPIPSELVLPLGGFLAAQGDFPGPPVIAIPLTIVAATIGSLIGAVVLYAFGAIVSEARVRAFMRDYGKYFLVSEDDYNRAESWFTDHGTQAVFIGRCIPGIRSIISIPAGVERMPMPQFLLFTAAGSAIWNTALIGAGAALGDQWERASDYVGVATYVVVALVVAAVAWFVIKRLRERNASPGPSAATTAETRSSREDTTPRD
ncbi:MAG: DedA family protein [Dehalococcoidia bacterium]